MNLLQPELCFVCNRDVLDKSALLSMETTLYSKTPFLTKLMQLLGDAFMVVILEDDKICLRCANLINRTDKLEQDLKKTQSVIRGFLNEKYDLNEEVEFSSFDEGLQEPKENVIYDEESLLHSPTINGKYSDDEGYKPNKYLKNKEELFEKSEIGCDVRIKSEPVLNSDNYLNNNDSHRGNCDHTMSEALLKKLPEDNIILQEKHSSCSDLNQIVQVQESQDIAVLKLKKETLSIDCKENEIQTSPPHVSNHPSPVNEISAVQADDLSHLDENTLTNKSLCNVYNSVEEIKDNNIYNVESSKGIAGNVSETELQNTAAEKELSEESKEKSGSSKANKQDNNKCTRKERTDNTIRKLRPILPKVSNVKDVLPSLYIIQHSDSGVCNEILNEQSKYNLSIKSESSDVKLNMVRESNPNQCTLNEAEQLNAITETLLTADLKTNANAINLEAFKSNEREHLQDRYKCSYCPKSFKRKTSAKTHEVLHTGNYTHYCEFCGQGFATLHKLEQHRRRHTKEENYMCDVCGKKFHFQGTYWIHRKWHDNPFPYKCDDCGKHYRHSSRLSIHRRKHRGERPYKCSYCPLTFDVSQTLKRHLVLHTRQYPYKCVTCDQGFTTRSKYTDHLARKHDTFVEKLSIDPKDYKVAVYNNVKENTVVESVSAEETVYFGESNCHFENSEISENSELIFTNSGDCRIEIILPPPSMTSDNNFDNNFSNISW